MTLTPSLTAPETPDAPIFEPVITGDALLYDLQYFLGHLSGLSGEQIAVRAGWTAGIVVAAVAVLWLLRFLLRVAARWLSPRHDKDAPAGKEARRNVGSWTMGAARFVVGMLALGTILYVWGIDARGGAVGQAIGVVWRAGLIFMFALAAVEISGFAITRVLHRGARHSRDLRRAAQLRTLAPVLKAVAHTFVIFVAVMMTLSEFGVDIGPLIAGAGIVGLAVGFGAQTIVKDFLTGIFLILEDAVSIGDVVSIREFGGVVEDMSLRTIKLRDFDGTLHIFPFSEAQVISNRTKSFSYAVFELSIDYGADIARALDVMRETGKALCEDPAFARVILADIEIVGVDRLADSAVILKARLKTAPGQQWSVQREYLRRIKANFDAAGVRIPFPHMKLVAPDAPIPTELLPPATDAAE